MDAQFLLLFSYVSSDFGLSRGSHGGGHSDQPELSLSSSPTRRFSQSPLLDGGDDDDD